MKWRCAQAALLGLVVLCCTAKAQVRYAISADDSPVKYFMEHPMHKWDATSKNAKGFVEIADDLSPGKVELTIPVTSFSSDNSNRDSHMAETVESYIYADVSFVSTKIMGEKYVGDSRRASSSWKVEGKLTFHGVTQTLNIPVDVVLEDKKLTATGTFELKLTDFQIELPSLMLMPVKDWIRISFNIVGGTARGPDLSKL